MRTGRPDPRELLGRDRHDLAARPRHPGEARPAVEVDENPVGALQGRGPPPLREREPQRLLEPLGDRDLPAEFLRKKSHKDLERLPHMPRELDLHGRTARTLPLRRLPLARHPAIPVPEKLPDLLELPDRLVEHCLEELVEVLVIEIPRERAHVGPSHPPLAERLAQARPPRSGPARGQELAHGRRAPPDHGRDPLPPVLDLQAVERVTGPGDPAPARLLRGERLLHLLDERVSQRPLLILRHARENRPVRHVQHVLARDAVLRAEPRHRPFDARGRRHLEPEPRALDPHRNYLPRRLDNRDLEGVRRVLRDPVVPLAHGRPLPHRVERDPDRLGHHLAPRDPDPRLVGGPRLARPGARETRVRIEEHGPPREREIHTLLHHPHAVLEPSSPRPTRLPSELRRVVRADQVHPLAERPAGKKHGRSDRDGFLDRHAPLSNQGIQPRELAKRPPEIQ
ncbi:MAG: hypothetical protein HY720_32360 [Planctomycetes bacterium]|nr:hypothetical protein [Planctomycetota bacterium]